MEIRALMMSGTLTNPMTGLAGRVRCSPRPPTPRWPTPASRPAIAAAALVIIIANARTTTTATAETASMKAGNVD